MPSRGTNKADDRRRQPRVSCRLHGRITHGREKIRARIVDISEGGLCLLLPVWLNPKQPLAIAIEVPGRETAIVHVEIWHIRREKSRSSNSKVWVAGAVLRDADTAYAQLLTAAGLAQPAATHPNPPPMPEPSQAAQPAGTTPSSASPAPASLPKSAPKPTPTPTASQTASPPRRAPAPTPPPDPIDDLEPRVFRLRCKAKGSPRTRVLSLAAESVEEAYKLAQPELGAEWDILEVLET